MSKYSYHSQNILNTLFGSANRMGSEPADEYMRRYMEIERARAQARAQANYQARAQAQQQYNAYDAYWRGYCEKQQASYLHDRERFFREFSRARLDEIFRSMNVKAKPDKKAIRCEKLRRMTVENGCTPQEEETAKRLLNEMSKS